MPSNSGGASAPISSVMIAPQSPPCATNFVYPRRFISTVQDRAMWAGSHPVVVGFPEYPYPGNDGITRWKASDALAPCAVGLVSGSTILSWWMIELGHPGVMISGNAFRCFERT